MVAAQAIQKRGQENDDVVPPDPIGNPRVGVQVIPNESSRTCSPCLLFPLSYTGTVARKKVRRIVKGGLVLKAILLTAVLLSMFVVSGCGVTAPVVPPTGLLYTGMGAPITTGGGEVGTRRGEASVTAILGLISTGDGSVAAAARNGRITKVSRVDYTYDNVLGIYQKYTTVAYGE